VLAPINHQGPLNAAIKAASFRHLEVVALRWRREVRNWRTTGSIGCKSRGRLANRYLSVQGPFVRLTRNPSYKGSGIILSEGREKREYGSRRGAFIIY
jgi:hypothetical protein